MIVIRTARERRLIAIALLMAVVTLAWFAVAKPVADGFAHRAAEREKLLDDHVRGQRLIASLEIWRERAIRQRASASAFSLAAPDAETATEMAKQSIADVVSGQGGQVKAVREEPSPQGAVRVRADLELTLTQLVASLSVLNNQKPYLVIEQLSVAADQAAAAGRLAPMEVSLDVAVPYVAPAS